MFIYSIHNILLSGPSVGQKVLRETCGVRVEALLFVSPDRMKWLTH